jgi:hypothetical protein
MGRQRVRALVKLSRLAEMHSLMSCVTGTRLTVSKTDAARGIDFRRCGPSCASQ